MPEATNTSTTVRNGADKAARTGVAPPPVPSLQQVFPAVPEAKAKVGITRCPNEGPSPDAWLIELCREWTELNAETDRLYIPAADTFQGSPEWAIHDRFVARTGDRWSELKRTIFATRPKTMAGLIAKAKVAEKGLSRDNNEELAEPNEPLTSLVLDILEGVPA